METFVLENDSLKLEFSRDTGALVELTALTSGWKILDRPELGLSFRLMVPLPGRRNNPVYGEKQPLTSLNVDPAGRSAVLIWDELKSEYGGTHAIRLTLRITLTARQSIWAVAIENRSDRVVENVYCPYLGDVQHPQDETSFRAFIYDYNTAIEWSLWPTYDNQFSYYSVDYPTQFAPRSRFVGAPTGPFFLLRGDQQGLYCGVTEPSCELVAWHTELRPGWDSSIDCRVPPTRTISGKPVATRFAAVHVPYIQPGETRALTPIALEAYLGDWQKGADIYKAWRDAVLAEPVLPDWVREPHAWQQIQINSPEDELRIRFPDLVQIGKECAQNGVTALQLVGWNDGGQDQGNPSHDPDPRLGTKEELREAIRQIQTLGVKVILFVKFTWADRATERFRQDLVRLAIKDPYGDYYMFEGYKYETATQLLDINTKRLVPMCFSSQEYLDVCRNEFQKVLDLNPDGILFDECLHHKPSLLCHDTSHGHRYGAPVHANDRKLIQTFQQMTAPGNPEFLYSGEACYDWELDTYHLSYHRIKSKDHIALSKYLRPHTPFMAAVTGFNDRTIINQCLIYGYILSYEPYHFKGRLGDFPLTLAYGTQMDALRTELRDYFWDGEFRDKVGATVLCDGKPYQPYSVFKHAVHRKEALVICNYDETESIRVSAALDSGQSLTRYRLVDDPTWRDSSQGILIPPQSAAVVLP